MYRKMTASPVDCVRTSQAGTKLDRTQTAEGPLRIGIRTTRICISQTNQRKLKEPHDFFIGARGVSGTAVTAGC